MKQTSDSLLTLFPIPFNAISDTPAFPRDKAGVDNRHCTPFTVHRENSRQRRTILQGLSCPPRSLVRCRLGEGRIRSLLHGTCFTLLAVCLMLPSVQSTLGAEGLVISLKEEAAIQSDLVFLKDIADLKGSDPNAIDRLARMPLGQAPDFGSVRILTRHQVIQLVRDAAGMISDESFLGAAAVQIKLQGKEIDASEIVPLLKARLLEKTQWKESELEIRSIGNLTGIELPPGEVELRLSSDALIGNHRGFLIPIEVVQSGKTLRCFWVSSEIRIHAGVQTAARKIARGTILTDDDIVEKQTEITDLRTAYVRDPVDVLGKVSRRSFSPGDPLTRDAFTDPYLVKNGETVRLRLERNGMVLTSLARAEQNGKLGQVIRVRNLDFSTILKAQVTGRAQVMLH